MRAAVCLFLFVVLVPRGSIIAENQTIEPKNLMDYSDDNDNLPRARRVKRDVEYDESLTCVPGSVMKAEGDLTKSLFKDKIFHNPWSTWNGESFKIRSILKLAMQKDHSNVPNSKKLDEILPIMKPTFPGSYSGDGVRVTWIGHSTIVVQFDNVTVLTDPLFSSRASPSQLFGPKRYRQPACMIEDLPETLDAVVISHNHYDHLDVGSVNALKNRYGDQLRWYVPLNLKKWFNDLGVQNVVELDWWEEYCAEKGIKFVLTPAQHWSKRGLNDDFHSLWGSWSIIGPRNRFFFTGDTGYCPVFEEIGKVYGPFTAAAIPIGAYSPRWFMSPQHVDPQQAVQIHRDIRSKSSMAIHWGTFALAYEFYLDPPKELKETLQEQNIPVNEFVAFKHGESRVLPLGGGEKSISSEFLDEKQWNSTNSNSTVTDSDPQNLVIWLSMINRFFGGGN